MRVQRSRVQVPEEVARAQRRRLRRTLWLYVAAIVALVVLGGGGLAVYNTVYQSDLSATQDVANAQAAYGQGNLHAALGDMRAAVAAEGDLYQARFDLGLLLLKSGDERAAIAELQRAAALNNLSSTHLYEAVADLALGRPAAARAQAQQANRIDPHEGVIVSVLGMADRGLGHAARARQELADANSLGFAPQTVQALISQANLE